MRTKLFFLLSIISITANAQFTSPVQLDLDEDFNDSMAIGSAIEYDGDASDELLIFSINLGRFYIVDELDGNEVIVETIDSENYSTLKSARAFDADNDGDDDILVLSDAGFFLYTREDDDSLVEHDLPGANVFRTYELVDINEDGFLDIIALNLSNSLIRVYFSDGPASFKAPVLVTTACESAKDFTILTKNGTKGIVFPQNISDAIAYIPLYADESFGPLEVLIQNPLHIEVIEAGDLTGDGLQELVLASNDRLLYLLNQGNGSVGNPYIIKFIDDVRDILAEDVTADGMKDIIYQKDDFLDRVILFENVNDGFFFQSATFDGPNIQTIVLGDFDNNGMPDLAADAWRGSDRLGVAFNMIPGSQGINEENSPNQSPVSVDELSIYPNPVQNDFRLSGIDIFDDRTVDVTIFDVQGKTIKQYRGVSVLNEFDASDLEQGIYVITVADTLTGNRYSSVFQKM